MEKENDVVFAAYAATTVVGEGEDLATTDVFN